jgi:3-dehydroquinate synthetase
MNAGSAARAAPSSRQTVTIDLGDRSYPIHIGSGLIDDPGSFAAAPSSSLGVIVSNTTVAPLYAERLARTLRGRHRRVELIVLPDGEARSAAAWSAT